MDKEKIDSKKFLKLIIVIGIILLPFFASDLILFIIFRDPKCNRWGNYSGYKNGAFDNFCDNRSISSGLLIWLLLVLGISLTGIATQMLVNLKGSKFDKNIPNRYIIPLIIFLSLVFIPMVVILAIYIGSL